MRFVIQRVAHAEVAVNEETDRKNRKRISCPDRSCRDRYPGDRG